MFSQRSGLAATAPAAQTNRGYSMNRRNRIVSWVLTTLPATLLAATILAQAPALAPAGAAALTAEDRRQFVERAAVLLAEQYVFPDVGEKTGNHLKARLAAGAFDSLTGPEDFCREVTTEMQSISHDKHMRARPLPPPPPGRGQEDPLLAGLLRQQELARSNYAFGKVEILPGNVGYLDFQGFADLAASRDTVSAAMAFLANADAIIIDLRRNGGGSPGTVQYLCSYFFDQRTHLNSLYYRRGNQTLEFWTLDRVAGRKMPDVPLFVLTSHYTFSGAEECAYNLQTRKRATLVGEVTGGGANPGGMVPVYKNMGIFIPNGRAINPVTGTNWEGVGVKPEIEVPADQSLDKALELARPAAEKQREKRKNELIARYGKGKAMLDQAVEEIERGNPAEGGKKLAEALGEACRQGWLSEPVINGLGYRYLGEKKYQLARLVMQYNVQAFPQSANACDSLAEACETAGDLPAALACYRMAMEKLEKYPEVNGNYAGNRSATLEKIERLKNAKPGK